MNKEKLKEIFEYAKEDFVDVILEITLPGRKKPEYIIVLNDNLDYKLKYYLENYNDNLELIRCPEIKILRANAIDTDEISYML